jgi:hypothetical protein
MINALILATILTTVVFVINKIIMKQEGNLWRYLLIFVLFFLINLFFPKKSEAIDLNPFIYQEEFGEVPDAQFQISLLRQHLTELNVYQKNQYQKLWIYHDKEAKRYFKEAEEICWYLPRLNNKESAYYYFNAAISALAPGSPIVKMCAVIGVTLTRYGYNCMDEWDKLQTTLNWAAYHSDLAEWYANVLKNG